MCVSLLFLTSEYVVGVDSGSSGHKRTVLLAGTVEEITVFTAGLFYWLIHNQITFHTCKKHHTRAALIKTLSRDGG